MSTISWFLGFLYSQFLVTPPKPTKSFAGQTVIVTGSNTGLGLEAARQITALNAAKVILAVRTISKGEAAKRSIEESTGRTEVVEVWSLDLSSYESVKEFAARATKELQRVDVLLENAGMMTSKFTLVEDNESTVTVNVVSTFLLALLMLPKMRETAQRYNAIPCLTVVSSDLHFITPLPESNATNIFSALNTKETANMDNRRYGQTKLLEILLIQHLTALTSQNNKSPNQPPTVIFNTLTPGACKSDFFRAELPLIPRLIQGALVNLTARSTEVGARTLVAAAAGGVETHGRYMADGVVSEESPFARSEEGRRVGERLWGELVGKLEGVVPGISTNV
ncbi:hypothetical protein MMC28_002352 [Mycoblastus sanguinarius]|nr:hypothetical protein [Mycoblastus sanguinarius]